MREVQQSVINVCTKDSHSFGFFQQMHRKNVLSLRSKTLQDCKKLPWTHQTDVEVSSLLFLLKGVILTTIVTTVTTVTNATITIWVFEFCHNLIFWVLSQFEFLSFVTIWVFEFRQNLSFWVLSQFEFFSFVTIYIFKFCHNLSFWVSSQFEFWVSSQFEFLSVITIWVWV